VSWLSRRGVFWVNLPVALLGVLLTRRFVPTPPPGERRRMDLVGQVLVIVGLAAVAQALNDASTSGWTSPHVLGAFGVGAIALVAFCVTEQRPARVPLLPLTLFRDSGFAATAVIGVLPAVCMALVAAPLSGGSPPGSVRTEVAALLAVAFLCGSALAFLVAQPRSVSTKIRNSRPAASRSSIS
jgi:MFS family permease